VPANSQVVIESSGLVLTGSPFRATNVRQLRHKPYSHYVETSVDYLVASSQCYGPYLQTPQLFPREHDDYQRIFEQADEVARFSASSDHPGPELRILKVRRANGR
jgi:non-ribosomal peptide synthetase component E (peptide arylation enzyme)